MKIYTEVNYELKDGVLEQVSSESFDYSGPILQCGGPPPKPPKIVETITEAVSDAGTTVTDTASDISSGITTTLGDAAETVQTNVEGATEGLGTAIETTKSNVGGLTEDLKGGFKYYKEELAKKMGMGDILGGVTAAAEDALGDTPAKREAPGSSESIGAGGQGGRKAASMGAVQKTSADAGGKRRLRKVSKSGAKV